MKVCVVQPKYSYNENELEARFFDLLAMLDECDESLDLIVLPEYSDQPADTHGKAGLYDATDAYSGILLQKVSETAKRCHAIAFVNCGFRTEGGVRNTTHAFDREGNLVGRYFKEHPAPSEVKTEAEGGHECDVAYSYEFREPYVLTIEGIRFAFLTCYDFYFYEYFAQIARQNVDVIIGCSLQRTDTHEALAIIGKFLCYQTNAYLVRASVSLGENSPVGGTSMVVSPHGEMLLRMDNDVGLGTAEIDPHAKYFKPAGYKGKEKAHYEYIEEGRRPWLYRNGGPSVVLPEDRMPYPRICAHRGFNTVAPENSLPAFGAAVSLGAEEIEFDIWATKDGVLVSSHDPSLERVSNGEGLIYEHTYEELLALDFGAKSKNEWYRGLKICTFEEILKKFSGRVIMNIHVKIWDMEQKNRYIPEIVSLIRKYDAEKYIYFMTTSDQIIREVQAYAPDLAVCVGWDGNQAPMSMVDRAIALGAKKVQLYAPYFNADTVKYAHENGIRCNVFYADLPEVAREYLSYGMDCILTNNYLGLYNAVKDLL